ncbi:phage tail tip lysozyme [Nocardia mangyaensis]|uniref:phage tail tip lysozyme n=1 Tax=Nocardia mangyaensis TaxID=2213200 RepID=UPI002677170B|nr:phage tail tip lysozyme [Nocardia mangyaensis]MDO3648256.1 phage tail tip lysozyme [Nocardia mangyaensis]
MVVTLAGQDGPVAHFRGWTVDLPHPAGSSAGLDSVIDAAEQAIQTSVDLFGSGAGGQALDLVEELEERGLIEDSDNQSAMVDDYASRQDEIDEIAAQLRRQNKDVDTSAYATSTTTGAAMSDIDREVDELESTLAVAGPAAGENRLSAVVEFRLLAAILQTVGAVHDTIAAASSGVVAEAGRINDSAPSYGSPSAVMNTGGYVPPAGGHSGYPPAAGDFGGGDYLQTANAEEISEGQRARVDEMYQRLLDNGFTPAQAAGILGNLQQESTFDTGAWYAAEGSLGLAQWRGDRLDGSGDHGERLGLRRFAAERGGSEYDWRIQIDFISYELQHYEKTAYAHLQNARTPGEAAAVFDQYYERSDGMARGKRIANANNIASSMTNTVSV